ncbi:C40 family peptidase [Micromonospora costi]|uniref:C40 family peptidase n=1 Tax=Micromonospora costi TaxID=1530042 RepID=UPI001319CFFE|nr:C40 family peptidase [Micromonospora costi]
MRTLVRVALLAVAAGALAVGPAVPAPAAARTDPSPAAEPLDVGDTAYVDVAVATSWVRPGEDRPVDAPAVGDPVDIRAWTRAMTLAERAWLIGRLETQATYGTEVTVLARSGDWLQVAVHGQPTPRHTLGYPGWMPAAQVRAASRFGALVRSRPVAQVTAPTAWLSADPGGRRHLAELSLNTRLPLLARAGTAIRVATPAGAGWLPADAVATYAAATEIPAPTGEDLVATARQFVGLPYLWAGTSAFGFDCSGFTHTVYGLHGVTIPRDAAPQYAAGTPVPDDQLQPGDLLFYGRPGRIHHVGMYAGDGYMIDAPANSSTTESLLEYVPMSEHRYAFEYAGARRFLP